jgi:hypothetical protein
MYKAIGLVLFIFIVLQLINKNRIVVKHLQELPIDVTNIDHILQPKLLITHQPINWVTINVDLDKYESCNPSFISHRGNLMVLLRVINYRMSHGLGLGLTIGKKTMTHLLLLKLNNDFIVQNMAQMKPYKLIYPFGTISYGYEDPRSFQYNGKQYLSVSINENELIKIKVIELSDDLLTAEKVITVVGHPDISKDQKNWIPFNWNDGLYWVYSYKPMVLLRVTHFNNEIIVKQIRGNDDHDDKWHLSSGVIMKDDKLLLLLHCKYKSDQNIIFRHKWVIISLITLITECESPEFHFIHHNGVEMVTNIINYNGQLIIGLSIEDEDVLIGRTNLHNIFKMLKCINESILLNFVI